MLGRMGRVAKLKLVQISHGMGTGGLERVIVTLCRGIDRDRFEPEVLTLKYLGALADELADIGIRVKLVNSIEGKADYIAPLRLARELRGLRADVVHTHNTQPFLEGGLGAVLARTPTLVHTDHARLYPDKLRYIAAERLMAKFAYRVVGVSDDTTAALTRYHRISPAKLCTIPNGIDGTPFEISIDQRAKRRELGIDGDGPVFGTIGRLVPQKGIDHLLHTMRLVVQRRPDATLVLAGTGNKEDELKALADTLGIADRVKFLGLRRDVAELLKVFDAYVLSSVWEGLPIALLEALAAGCPIVSTSVGGVPTVVQPGVNGELVPAGDAPALANALVDLLGDSEKLAAYRRGARRLFLERFTIEHMVRAYEKLYTRSAS
jgi:glycosyltransferase involved in cell wall biosynthesis